MSDYHQEQIEIQRELERVYRCIEKSLSPNDQTLVRWAFGIGEVSRKDQWGAIECEGQEQLFV